MKRIIFFIIICILLSRADEYHYKNILIGDRASGLGGTYIAISEDPSGIYYNPAGLSFIREGYISLSSNVYVKSTYRYKNVVANQDYLRTSFGLIPNFFGFVQGLSSFKLGFGIIVPQSDILDQDDVLTNLSTSLTGASDWYSNYNRTLMEYHIGLSIAPTLHEENYSYGLSLFVVQHRDDIIDNQTIIFNNQEYLLQNYYVTKRSYSLLIKPGWQYMLTDQISIGVTGSYRFDFYNNGTIQKFFKSYDANDTKIELKNADAHTHFFPNQDMNHTDVDMPEILNFGVGAAYFFSNELLISSDINLYFPDPDYNYLAVTTNISLGVEYYPKPWLPLRFGIYTNPANTKNIEKNKINQKDHVDLYGGTFSIGWSEPGSFISVTSYYSYGKGDAQIIEGTTQIQDLIVNSWGIFITGGYQL